MIATGEQVPGLLPGLLGAAHRRSLAVATPRCTRAEASRFRRLGGIRPSFSPRPCAGRLLNLAV